MSLRKIFRGAETRRLPDSGLRSCIYCSPKSDVTASGLRMLELEPSATLRQAIERSGSCSGTLVSSLLGRHLGGIGKTCLASTGPFAELQQISQQSFLHNAAPMLRDIHFRHTACHIRYSDPLTLE